MRGACLYAWQSPRTGACEQGEWVYVHVHEAICADGCVNLDHALEPQAASYTL
jgi:hypothetical protein